MRPSPSFTKTAARVAIIGIATALAVLGCTAKQSPPTPQASQTKTIEVSYDELLNEKFITRDITLAVGDTLKVNLATSGSTGFRWTEAQIGDSAVLQQTNHETVPPTNAMPGAPSTETWTFTALKTGTTTVATDYNQPWAGGTQGAWTFRANVAVQ